MALELQKPTNYGVDALYWRVRSVEIKRDQGTASWALDGHVSKANSDAGGIPVDSRVYAVRLGEVAAGPQGQLLGATWAQLGKLLYLLSKSIPCAGAEDVEFAQAGDV